MVASNKSWVRLCDLEQVPTDHCLNIYVNGQRLVITRYEDSAHVLQGYCSHMLFYLKDAKVDGCVVTCSLHGSQFDVRDGSVVRWTEAASGKVLEDIKEKKRLRSYETEVRDGSVFLAWATNDPDKVKVKF